MTAEIRRFVGPNKATQENTIAMLESLLDDLRRGRQSAPKALVLLLDDRNEQYDHWWVNAGMRLSETISLLEVSKDSILGEMQK